MSECKHRIEVDGVYWDAKIIIRKYLKLLEFVKKCAHDYYDWENCNEMSFDATEILQEIGEL